MNRKGITATIFNWIFVIIAGGVILLFFFKLIAVQTQISERESTSKILKDMQSVISARITGTGGDAEFLIPDKEFIFECKEPCNRATGCDSFITIEGSPPVFTRTQVIFTSKKIRARKLFTFARSWDVPFQVTNFLYITSPGEKIVFPPNCNTNTFCRRIFESIPKRIRDAEIVVQDTGFVYEDAKYITFGTCPIDPSRKEICFKNNQVHFFPDFIPHDYFLDESILGAIFSEDSSIYECNMNKAFFQLQNSIQVMEGKRNEMFDFYNSRGDVNCRNAMDNLDLDSLNLQYPDESTLDSIERTNDRLRRFSCSSLY